MSEQIIKIKTVTEFTGLSPASVYRFAARGEFPKPIKLGQRSSGWLKSEVEEWICDRILASRGETQKTPSHLTSSQ